jgi:integrase/recombinase XerD
VIHKEHRVTQALHGDCFAALVEQLGYYLLGERGLSYNYFGLTSRVLLKFSAWRAENGLLDSPIRATTQQIAAFLAAEKVRGLGPGSLKITVYALKAFFGFLKRRHLADRDPTLILHAPKVPLLLPHVLNEPETAQLMAVDFTKRPVKSRARVLPLRDRAVLEMLYATGVRNSELITAKLQNLDLEARTLRVLGKGNKERLVLFGRPAAMALAEYLEDERKRRVARARHITNRDREAIFLSWNAQAITYQRCWQLLQEARLLSGLDKPVYPHLLRHTCATHLYRHGADLLVIKELLGHADLNTTQRYVHIELSGLIAVYKRCHPRALLPTSSSA